MENLIPTLNKLQDVFATVGAHAVDLPQIVAVGCQSAGKSSVLEAIVQRDFLPRGAGICTRRPLILQLIHENGNVPEWGEFLHCKGKRWTNFNEIMHEIEAETERVCGNKKGVVDKPINLAIHSPKVVTLTLVDLPGLTKIAVEDQPPDIAVQIDKMVMSYIKPENAIILAITPANMDLANSDALIAAKKVDPQGNRTIGVITKLDIMDRGTNARDVLLNKVYPLKLGYIGVINRGQAAIDSKKSIVSAAAEEAQFFQNTPAYRDIASNCGTPFLAQSLNQILMKHIKSKLPSLYAQINNLLSQKQLELASYGSSLGITLEDQQMFIFDVVSKFMDQFEGRLNGGYAKLFDTELDGGSELISELIDEFPQRMLSIPSVKEIPEEMVLTTMKSNEGLNRSLFFPEQTFHTLIKGEIEKLRQPAMECITRSKGILVDLFQQVDFPELKRFTSLKDSIIQVVTAEIEDASREAQKFANSLVNIQLSYINTHHPDFEANAAQINAASASNVSALVNLVHRYYVIVRKEIIDTIPKAIYRCLFVDCCSHLREKLVKNIVLEPDLHEDPVVSEKRKNCIRLIDALKKASATLSEVRKAQA